MALNTYSGLQSAVISALHRADLAAVVPDFITLAEDKLNKRLRLRGMEIRATASATGGSEYLALPSRFLSMRNLQVNSSPRQRLEYATPEWLDVKYPDTTRTGLPKYYSLIGGQIQLAPIPDTTYTVELDYYQQLALATDLTNSVLTNSPRTYYYGTLMEAAAYLMNDKRVPLWENFLELAIKEAILADETDSQPDYGLQIRPDGTVL